MSKLVLFVSVLMFGCLLCPAQSTLRKKVKPQKAVVRESVKVERDTVTDANSIAKTVRCENYQKVQYAAYESLSLTNLSACDTIFSVTVDIDYSDMAGNQLNRRDAVFEVVIPPGQTRHSTIPAWDKQRIFYYKDNPPVRGSQRSKPFTVKLVPVSIITNKTK